MTQRCSTDASHPNGGGQPTQACSIDHAAHREPGQGSIRPCVHVSALNFSSPPSSVALSRHHCPPCGHSATVPQCYLRHIEEGDAGLGLGLLRQRLFKSTLYPAPWIWRATYQHNGCRGQAAFLDAGDERCKLQVEVKESRNFKRVAVSYARDETEPG